MYEKLAGMTGTAITEASEFKSIYKLDVLVIVSGDGDYLPLVSYLQNNKGCLVEIMAFRKTCSSRLIEEADDYTDLGSSKKFLIYSNNNKK
jgi:uncharacterized LabA/DUF88 family protein